MLHKLKYYFKIFIESRYLLLFDIVEKFFFFVIFLCFARVYSTDIYGELITTFTISTIFITILNLGFPIFLQREVSIKKNDSVEAYSQIININIFISLVYFIFILLFYFLFYSHISFVTFILTSFIVFLFSLINTLNSALSGLSQFKKRFIILLYSRSIIIVIFIPLIFLFRTGIYYFLALLSFGSLLQIFWIVIDLKKMGYDFISRIDIVKIKSIIKLSFPIGLAVIFNFLYDKIDIVLISKFLDFSQVAYYNIGYGIYKSSAIAFSFLLVSGFTRISALKNKKYAVKIFFIKYLINLISISLVLSAILFFASEVIVKIIYTDKYFDSILILKIMSFAVIGLTLNNLTGVILNGLGFFKENMFVTLSGLLINVILNIIFIPLFGIIASAVISIVTEYFIFAGDYYYLQKFFKSR
jgi:O-antigen/teichoic acid export membrane protein